MSNMTRHLCKTYSCTYEKGLRLEQNHEYEELSLRADSVANTPTETEILSDELSSNIQPPSLDEIRGLRMAYYQNSSLVPPTHDYTVNCNSRAITSHFGKSYHKSSCMVYIPVKAFPSLLKLRCFGICSLESKMAEN